MKPFNTCLTGKTQNQLVFLLNFTKNSEKVIPHIIHTDQTGFIKGQHFTNNTRKLQDLIEYCNTHNKEAITVSLDAEKDFNMVNWRFQFATLQKFGLNWHEGWVVWHLARSGWHSGHGQVYGVWVSGSGFVTQGRSEWCILLGSPDGALDRLGTAHWAR